MIPADMNQWVKYSIGMAGACGLVTAWVIYFEANHEHHHYPDRAYKTVSDSSCRDADIPRHIIDVALAPHLFPICFPP